MVKDLAPCLSLNIHFLVLNSLQFLTQMLDADNSGGLDSTELCIALKKLVRGYGKWMHTPPYICMLGSAKHLVNRS